MEFPKARVGAEAIHASVGRQVGSQIVGPVLVGLIEQGECLNVLCIVKLPHTKNRANCGVRVLHHVVGSAGLGPLSGPPDAGSELYQSIKRVKYIAPATAAKLAIAPTSKALSSSRSSI